MIMMLMIMLVMMMVVVMLLQVMSKCHECEFRRNSFHHNGAAHGLRYTGRFIIIISIMVVIITIIIIIINVRLDKIELNHFEGQCSGEIQNDGASIQVNNMKQWYSNNMKEQINSWIN